MKREPYPSELSDAEWQILEPLIPPMLGSVVYGLTKRLEKLGYSVSFQIDAA